MVEAEAERKTMGAGLETLESEKKELETTNNDTIRENHRLLAELERLNGSISTAEDEILSLNTTLQSALQEVDRLTSLAAQTARLESQLEILESDHADLLKRFSTREESASSANQRWRRAEVTINALQEQLERIEKEAADERARHAEVVSRFERRKNVERELNAAGSRLARADGKMMGQEDDNSTVVSDFVKEVLQDNANLQLGIMELRDMLMGSNEEVQNLREQIMLHQPLPAQGDNIIRKESLDDELARASGNESASDFHVHHHYHAAPKAAGSVERPAVPRRTKRRRSIVVPHSRVPTTATQAPHTPTHHHHRQWNSQISAKNTILSQTSVTIPPSSNSSHIHKWSMSQAPSSAASLPSSPMFDRIDDFLDSSRPTTPGSVASSSPPSKPRHTQQDVEVSLPNGFDLLKTRHTQPQSISGVLSTAETRTTEHQEEPEFSQLDDDIILEEPEEGPRTHSGATSIPKPMEDHNPFDISKPIQRTLHRASSHESLLSVHGLAPPKLRSNPSPRLFTGSLSRPSLATTSTSSTGPITSGTWATAQRSKPFRRYDSSNNYSKLLLTGAASTSPPSVGKQEKAGGTSLGQRMGGWIAGKWGTVPETTMGSLTPTSPREKSGAGKQRDPAPENRLSTHVEPEHLDESLLRDTLGEYPDATASKQQLPSTTAGKGEFQVLKKGSEKEDTASRLQERSPPRAVPQPQRRGKDEEKRLSTHVEPVSVDSGLLAESLMEI